VSVGCPKGTVCVRKGWVAPQTEWGGRQPRVKRLTEWRMGVIRKQIRRGSLDLDTRSSAIPQVSHQARQMPNTAMNVHPLLAL
jgi:hypothetical protein